MEQTLERRLEIACVVEIGEARVWEAASARPMQRRLPRVVCVGNVVIHAPILVLLEQTPLCTSYSCIILMFAATTLLRFLYLLLKVIGRRS